MTWKDILKEENDAEENDAEENDAFTSPIGKRLKEYIERKYGEKDVSKVAEMYLKNKKNNPDLTEEKFYTNYLNYLIQFQIAIMGYIDAGTRHRIYDYVVGGEDDKLKEELRQNMNEFQEIRG